MTTYKLHQCLDINKEGGECIKELNVNTCLHAEGISQQRVTNMLIQFSNEFSDLIESENYIVQKGFAELNKKLIEEGGVQEYDRSV